MSDLQNCYYDNINMFKTLKQYNMAIKSNKQKMMKAFCSNSVPRNRGFNALDMLHMGIQTALIHYQQKKSYTYWKGTKMNIYQGSGGLMISVQYSS